uniref:Ion transport domain-containing protein n=1 Tax=Romanomermis culicivorax TaxID=13658 RepID=A0A915K8C1_ROMCU
MASVTKAAAISSAMLARKQSFKARESFGILADLLADETQEISDINWFEKRIPHVLLIIACFASLVSVSINTPQMFLYWDKLLYITYGVDLAVTLLFTLEAAFKMKNKGIMKKTKGYMRDKWCQFDFFMLACHWLSVIVQTIQIPHFDTNATQVQEDTITRLGLFRSPRPLIMVRLIRSLFRVQLPRNRISQVIKRSGQQVKNVTIFFSFFMSLYSILGVQFFGRMDYHCVRNDSDPKNEISTEFTRPQRHSIPDTFCIKNSTENCPEGMKCEKLRLNASDEGYYGMFNNFVFSIFSVYMAASQEGWVYVMYDCIDSLPSWRAFVYFTTLIFFLAWLVKNVFIAVITETFAEIRVQFSQMWGNRELLTEEEVRQILEKGEDGWRLVALDENTYEGWAPKICQRFQRSMPFQVTVMIIILANAFFAASIVHKHDGTDAERKLWYYYVEVRSLL